MTISKRRKRTFKKMILPLAAVALMFLMMYIGRPTQPVSAYHKAPAGAAARAPHTHTR